jgi:hypothetical protein
MISVAGAGGPEIPCATAFDRAAAHRFARHWGAAVRWIRMIGAADAGRPVFLRRPDLAEVSRRATLEVSR